MRFAGFLLLFGLLVCRAWGDPFPQYDFNIQETSYTRLCQTKNILTVNGQFPGPTLYVQKGDTILVNVHNQADYNITIHWHGLVQPRNPWSDGPAYITQCPIQPGASFTYRLIFSEEEGTIWWHAHIDWDRATVHGAIIIHPQNNANFPFPTPQEEIPIILGEWWKGNVSQVIADALRTGGAPNISDAYTINGQPGDLYPCSQPNTFIANVEYSKTYLLRVINAALNNELFFAIANHPITVVAKDASYLKPFSTDFIMIAPGQTIDVLLDANNTNGGRYYMAAHNYASAEGVPNDTTTTTAILQYNFGNPNLTPAFPSATLPNSTDNAAATEFVSRLRSLGTAEHPVSVPQVNDQRWRITVAVNLLPCDPGRTCLGPNFDRFAASLNNLSFVLPSTDVLDAYYKNISRVYGTGFPAEPPLNYNFTGENLPGFLLFPRRATEVRLVEYNTSVEIVFQGTTLLAAENHPLHLHGFSFYVVGRGFGNFDEEKDPLSYNLVDPPYENTVGVPRSGWVALRFWARNPGVWFMHCHLDQHTSWGMETVLIIQETSYTRLCETKKILTVNGQFPGPTIYAEKGDTLIVRVYNKGDYNITLHWHGLAQPRNPWSDGPEYITQCPIQPGAKFTYRLLFSEEEGTIWWHAHSDWDRATVHGALIVYPKKGTTFPFPKPHKEIPIILGEWWKANVSQVVADALQNGSDPQISDAFTINGQPGDLYPCSKPSTFIANVEQNKTYLLRLINAAINNELFFSIANHSLTVVGKDASYTKPYSTNLILISPGQTIDVLLHTNASFPGRHYIAAKSYSSAIGVKFDLTTTTAILQYVNSSNQAEPLLPSLPEYNDTAAATAFETSLRSLASKEHPVSVPQAVDQRMIITVAVNLLTCEPGKTCGGPNGDRLSSSLNNISFVTPTTDVLDAYYKNISGVYGTGFPADPPATYNYTGENLPGVLLFPRRATEVRVVEYNTSLEIVYQGTNLLAGENHPLHLHGFSFYVVGRGFGNFDEEKDPLSYNLVDPPYENTVGVPKNGWAAVRFRATNPGVWFMHCHLDRHASWGMETVLIVKDGDASEAKLLPPPPDMPPC
ncbi:hypothetical protein IEQ34_000079 [Dendrobium chrysotoxum]|uniref:Laccase n=1 Tax=Dendrobium chrysotoxum TaxID=161865 RepID=A0AAV7HMI9_DENCH|nr:hypothetical protein IEQ34_000079 [Dendrobium chrysotoxum]